MFTFDLDLDSAKSEAAGGRIDSHGAVKGKFTQAYGITSSQKGAKGVHLSFQADNGQKAEIDLWVASADGAPYLSRKTLDAIMVICKVKSLKSQVGKVTKWDWENKKEITVEADVLPEITNKPIELLLNMEGSVNPSSGKVNYKPVIVASANMDGFTGAEVASRATEATMREKLIKTLRTIEPKGVPAPTSGTSEERVVDSSDADLPWN